MLMSLSILIQVVEGGAVSRDCDGNFLEGGTGNFIQSASALEAEAIAAIKSL
jgi:hypothetical protein